MICMLTVTLILTSLTWGCAVIGKKELSTSAYHASRATEPGKYTLVYSLPKTTLRISVHATETVTRRGPYYQYAERFLGISGVPDSDDIIWSIDSIGIGSYQEADPGQYYVLTTNDRYVANFFRLTGEGFILPVNREPIPELEGFMVPREKEVRRPLFTDLSIQPWVVEETRTVMRMVRQDTAFVNVPVMQRQSVTRSLQDKAAEVADLIFELRNNRFKLLSGDLDLFPDGKALEAIINEFARLEKEYLALFTGKVIESRHRFIFEYSPDKAALKDNLERHILFRLSDAGEILPPDDLSGRPVTLELYNEMKTAQLDRISQSQAPEKEGSGTLFYRIPDVASLRLTDGNNVIAGSRISVSQYGKVVTIPADFLW